MRVIVAGSRGSIKKDFTFQCMKWAEQHAGIKPTHIVSGVCRDSPDMHGVEYAAIHGLPLHGYPADWVKHKNSAGMVRNCVMRANADALVAVWDGQSPGTKHMIEQMQTYGKLWFYFDLSLGEYFYGKGNSRVESKEGSEEAAKRIVSA